MDSGCSLLINSKLLWLSIQACCDCNTGSASAAVGQCGEEHGRRSIGRIRSSSA
uniref:Uncharacterized protein n=1 Tax=Triticum urartu TaxID=4572 RepID=A0A8R7TVF8_TRIUA